MTDKTSTELRKKIIEAIYDWAEATLEFPDDTDVFSEAEELASLMAKIEREIM